MYLMTLDKYLSSFAAILNFCWFRPISWIMLCNVAVTKINVGLRTIKVKLITFFCLPLLPSKQINNCNNSIPVSSANAILILFTVVNQYALYPWWNINRFKVSVTIFTVLKVGNSVEFWNFYKNDRVRRRNAQWFNIYFLKGTVCWRIACSCRFLLLLVVCKRYGQLQQ